MLKLYAVQVWRMNEPRNYENIEVRTFTARRAQDLAIESYPGCNAHILGVLVEGTWHCAAHDDWTGAFAVTQRQSEPNDNPPPSEELPTIGTE